MRDLTKWPRLLCVGDPVTFEQAEDIILRTTDITPCTNDVKWGQFIEDVLVKIGGKPKELADIDWHVKQGGGAALGRERKRWFAQMIEHDREMHTWRETMGVLDLHYLCNDRVASTWIHGPHGWVDWDGSVGCSTWNIGKWPSHDEVTADVELIANAFPYLTATFQLVPDEGEYVGPVVEWRVAGGAVKMRLPSDSEDVLPAITQASKFTTNSLLETLFQPGRERGIDPIHYAGAVQRWAQRRGRPADAPQP